MSQPHTNFSVIESLCVTSKGAADNNEDRLIVSDHFVAAIDGATSSNSMNGRSGGLIAAQAVADTFARLDAQATAREFVELATSILAERIGGGLDPKVMRPSASVVVWSRARQQIWRVGDCHFRLDDQEFLGEKELDRIAYAFRRAVVRGRLALGVSSIEQERAIPTLQQPFMALVDVQHAFLNADIDDPLAYGAIDGCFIPDRFIEVFPAEQAKEVALCSDGFPRPYATLAGGLAALEKLRRDDPLMIYANSGSRPFPCGSAYFDDTTYVRIRVDIADQPPPG